MSEESRHHEHRLLEKQEIDLLAFILGREAEEISLIYGDKEIVDMNDGGMGGVRFIDSGYQRRFGCQIASAEFIDVDGIPVSIAVNLDQEGNIFEIDFWKVDFSRLIEYPRPNSLKITSKGGAAVDFH